MSTPTPDARPPASPRPRQISRYYLAVAVAVALVAALSAAIVLRRRHPRSLRIATGLRGGTFLPLGEELARVFSRDGTHLAARAVESPGGEASVAMLARGEVDLALLSSNARGGDAVRLVAPLYQETVQVVVRRDAGIATPLDLRGRRVGVGPAGSGTEAIAWQILSHFGVNRGQITPFNLTPTEAQQRLTAGELDAVFIVAGMRTPVVDALLARDDMRLLSLGDTSHQGNALEGIRLDAPFLHTTVIPQHAYGAQPPEPVGTLDVTALLVARRDLDDDTVAEVSRALFADRVALAEREHLLAHLTERFDPAEYPFPVHPGTDRYLRRDEPSLVTRYNDQISLGITVGALLWSALTALAAARRRSRKSRVEVFYEQARALRGVRESARDRAALQDVRGRLGDVRARAVEELLAERLEPNESFSILLEMLRAELYEVDQQLAALAPA